MGVNKKDTPKNEDTSLKDTLLKNRQYNPLK